jgi:hypothetical protein
MSLVVQVHSVHPATDRTHFTSAVSFSKSSSHTHIRAFVPPFLRHIIALLSFPAPHVAIARQIPSPCPLLCTTPTATFTLNLTKSNTRSLATFWHTNARPHPRMKCILPFEVTFPFHPPQYSPNALISASLSLFAKQTNVHSLSFTPLLTSSRTSVTTWRYVPLLPQLPAMPISRQLCACSFKRKILVAAV